ncbi:uncharacterized protein AB675_1540 [Cyphellophora attinorum]|uniref:Uncharacterized protein n=1 Tax=Cyphellophora attinorum TaxID=1664694 RepID=A0A0N1HKK1_9EURO|nr:uncharacterized protein AB675_1540 [Phialophora attinorum]KPI37300.1 hypothetical protein AB675_1540 [Phialophora attinorum]
MSLIRFTDGDFGNIRVLELFHWSIITDPVLGKAEGSFSDILLNLPALREVRFLVSGSARCLASATCQKCIQRLVLSKFSRPQLDSMRDFVAQISLRDIKAVAQAQGRDLNIEIRRPVFQVYYIEGNAGVDKHVDWNKYYPADAELPRYLNECLTLRATTNSISNAAVRIDLEASTYLELVLGSSPPGEVFCNCTACGS